MWCPGAELNHRHADFQSAALPTELPGQALLTQPGFVRDTPPAVHPTEAIAGLMPR